MELDSALLGMFMAFIGVMIAAVLFFYIFTALVIMSLSKKTNTDKEWLAWIPIANVYQLTRIGGLEWWWTLLVFASVIPVIGGIVAIGAMIYIWWRVAEKINKPGWWSLLLLIPIVNLVIMGIMAWGK